MSNPNENNDGTILDQYVPDTVTEAVDEGGTVAVAEEEVEEIEVPTTRNTATGLITVTCGANVNNFGEIAGKSIGQLRQDLGDVLNIAPESKVVVSGEEVSDDYILAPGDRVEFIKASGVKG